MFPAFNNFQYIFREDRHDRGGGGGFNDRYERGYDGPPAGRNFGGGRGGGAGAGGAGGGAARGGQATEDADGVNFGCLLTIPS